MTATIEATSKTQVQEVPVISLARLQREAGASTLRVLPHPYTREGKALDALDKKSLIQQAIHLIEQYQPTDFSKRDPRVQVSWLIYFYYTFQEAFTQEAVTLVNSKPIKAIESYLEVNWGLKIPDELTGLKRARYIIDLLDSHLPETVKGIVVEQAVKCCEVVVEAQLGKLTDTEIDEFLAHLPVSWVEVSGGLFKKETDLTDQVIQDTWVAFIEGLKGQRKSFKQSVPDLLTEVDGQMTTVEATNKYKSEFLETGKQIRLVHEWSSSFWGLCDLPIRQLLLQELGEGFEKVTPEDLVNEEKPDGTKALVLVLAKPILKNAAVGSVTKWYEKIMKEKDFPPFEEFMKTLEETLLLYPDLQKRHTETIPYVQPAAPFTETAALATPIIENMADDKTTFELPIDPNVMLDALTAIFTEYKAYSRNEHDPSSIETLRVFIEILKKRISQSSTTQVWKEAVTNLSAFVGK